MLNMSTGKLCCSNKNCNFIVNPMKILWSCISCGKEFKSKAIPYNPLEITLIKKVIRQTLLLKHRAHPNKLPCCDLNVYFTDFYHKKICRVILFEGELNDKMIIVCEKFKAINFHERFLWTCPKCGKKFRDIINLLTEEQIEKNNKKGIMPDIQKEYIEKEKKEDMWDKYKKSSLKAVIDSPVKNNDKGIYKMLMARKENFEEDVLANFRLKALHSGKATKVDKYEGIDIYEDKTDKKIKINLEKKEIKIEMNTPKKSPYIGYKKTQDFNLKKSPYNSPKMSPNKKIYLSPKKGILKNKSPSQSPNKSPKKVSINLDMKSDKEDDLTINNDTDEDSIIDIEEEEEEENNKNENNMMKKSIKQSLKRSIIEKTKGKEINEKEKKEE